MSDKYDTAGSTSTDADGGSDDDGLGTTSQSSSSDSENHSETERRSVSCDEDDDDNDYDDSKSKDNSVTHGLDDDVNPPKTAERYNDDAGDEDEDVNTTMRATRYSDADGDKDDNVNPTKRAKSYNDDSGDEYDDVTPKKKAKLHNNGEDKVGHRIGSSKIEEKPTDDVRFVDIDDNDNSRRKVNPSKNLDGNMHVVATHYNELKEAGRKERSKSRILHMRNFNNWIKSQLINEYMGLIKKQEENKFGVPIRVLDMCCGKGGDLLKWEKANVTHLICTDIADISVEQCQKRYNDMLSRSGKFKYSHTFSAEFFACDSTLVRLRQRYKDPTLELNLVSCQFAFHYSFESLSQADCMVRNAAECLKPGGYFIATIPDAYEIVRRLHKSPNGKSFGNDLYNIEFKCKTDPPPLFGAKYQFHLENVVDCPEFLVYFPALVKLCRKHGLKLVRKTTFADYCKESIIKGRNLLHRMNGLESVNFYRCGNDEQFAHVRNYVGPNRGRPFGTLSKAEWEATTLYSVCAFQKCKSTWDTKGMPVFNFD